MKTKWVRFFNNFATSLIVVLVISICVESGLQFRSWLNAKTPHVDVEGNGKNLVMLIGDSVLGIQNDISIAAKLEKALDQRWPGVYSVVNLSYPANSSGRVETLIDSYLEEYKPQYVLLMLGRNDSTFNFDSRLGAASTTEAGARSALTVFLSHLKLVQLTYVELHKIRSWLQWSKSPLEIPDGEVKTAGQNPAVRRQMQRFSLLEFQHEYGQLWEELEKMHADAGAGKYRPIVSCTTAAWLAKVGAEIQKPEAADYLRSAVDCFATLKYQESNGRARASIATAIGMAFVAKKDDQEGLKYFKRATAMDPTYFRSFSERAWLYKSQANCAAAIPDFEAAIRLYPTYRMAIFDLYGCYMQEKKLVEGSGFFLTQSLHSNESFLLESLSKALTAEKFGHLLLSPMTDVRREEPVADREAYLATLWQYRKKGQKDKARALFLKGDFFPSKEDFSVNANSYHNIVDKVVSQGAKVIEVNYPNESDAPLIGLTAQFPKDVYFFSLRQVVSDAFTQHDLFAIFDDDFLHLTNLGADLCASALAEKINSVRQAQ